MIEEPAASNDKASESRTSRCHSARLVPICARKRRVSVRRPIAAKLAHASMVRRSAGFRRIASQIIASRGSDGNATGPSPRRWGERLCGSGIWPDREGNAAIPKLCVRIVIAGDTCA